MAFHPYPQLIRWLFNARRFGPPPPFTAASPWPWIDHSVSRLPHPTGRPVQTRFRFGCSAERINLAGQVQLVGSLSKRHAVTSTLRSAALPDRRLEWFPRKHSGQPSTIQQPFLRMASQRRADAPTACKHTVSGTVSLAFSAFFSPFPHGTCSLSVIQSSLALADGAARFMQGFTGPALLRIPLPAPRLRLRDSHPLRRGFPDRFDFARFGILWSYNPQGACTPGLGCSAFARHYLRNHCCFLLEGT